VRHFLWFGTEGYCKYISFKNNNQMLSHIYKESKKNLECLKLFFTITWHIKLVAPSLCVYLKTGSRRYIHTIMLRLCLLCVVVMSMVVYSSAIQGYTGNYGRRGMTVSTPKCIMYVWTQAVQSRYLPILIKIIQVWNCSKEGIDLFCFDVYLPNSNHTRIQIICDVDIRLHFDIKKELSRDFELGNMHTKRIRSIGRSVKNKKGNQSMLRVRNFVLIDWLVVMVTLVGWLV